MTPLHDRHVALGGRMVDFAGFRLPLSYSGIVAEHHAVRKAAGIFDVSHMGEAWLSGPRALEVAMRLCASDVSKLGDGQALYTVMCRPEGGIVDDCVVSRLGDRYLVVLNAANIAKDLAWIGEVAAGACDVIDESAQTALLALQGPEALAIAQSIADAPLGDLAKFGLRAVEVGGVRATASRSGYTGEDGLELFCAAGDAVRLFDSLLEAGRPRGLQACGLGARDTLRLEARLCLYGNDLDDTTSPLEAGLGWLVHLAHDFVGRDALARQKAEGVTRRLSCLVMRERGIARHGMALCRPAADGIAAGPAVGVVTSGSPSPTLGQNIALGYLPPDLASPGASVIVDVRGKSLRAEVVRGPFYKREAPRA